MLFARGHAQFAHIAQDEHLLLPRFQCGKRAQGGGHACGIGVVGIHDERVVVGLCEL